MAEIKGEKVTYTVYRISNRHADYERWGTPRGGVAVPATLTATMLAKGEIKTKGVIPPEALDPEQFLAKLAEKGFIFQEKITRKIRS